MKPPKPHEESDVTAPTPHAVQRYGWIPDLPDHRDLLFAAAPEQGPLPAWVDLRGGCPPVYDQGNLGSCTANAIAAAYQFEQRAQKAPDWVPSRLFIYYNERVIEHTVDSDSGAMIRDGVKSVAKQGVCPETAWPYLIEMFATRPPIDAYRVALQNRALTYRRVPRSLTQMKGCLAAGAPFIFGFSVYASFESVEVARTGLVPMPGGGEELLGGHAVLAVGYTDATQRFLVRNSWGSGWGRAGYFSMPYAYLLDRGLASDFWTISKVS